MGKYGGGGAQDGFDNRSLDCTSYWMAGISKDGHLEGQGETDRGSFLNREPEQRPLPPGWEEGSMQWGGLALQAEGPAADGFPTSELPVSVVRARSRVKGESSGAGERVQECEEGLK